MGTEQHALQEAEKEKGYASRLLLLSLFIPPEPQPT